jgi:hypothetical protein
MAINAPEADVEIVRFPKTPAVAREIPTEIELGLLGVDPER